MVVRGVQRLVHIADQVQQKLERDRPFRRGPRIAQLRHERLDAVDDAGLCRTEACRHGTRRMAGAGRRQIRVVQLGVDEVPRAGEAIPLLRGMTIAVAILVRPGRAAGDIGLSQRVGVVAQDLVDGRARGRRKVRIGNQGDDPMSLVPPGKGRGRGEHGHARQHERDKPGAATCQRLHARPPCQCVSPEAIQAVHRTLIRIAYRIGTQHGSRSRAGDPAAAGAAIATVSSMPGRRRGCPGSPARTPAGCRIAHSAAAPRPGRGACAGRARGQRPRSGCCADRSGKGSEPRGSIAVSSPRLAARSAGLVGMTAGTAPGCRIARLRTIQEPQTRAARSPGACDHAGRQAPLAACRLCRPG